jgi:peptidoglycan L-alanyl-D-glutamate endopeptidase CwlK
VNKHSEGRLALVYPELARRARLAEGMLETLGFSLEISQGLRTWDEQNSLYAKGRNLAGEIIDENLVVTHAKGGESYHNFGLALDFFFESPDGAAIWDETFPGYPKAVEIFEGLGLVCGANWHGNKRDADHVQLTTGFAENAPDDHVKYLFKEDGFRAVYREMDRTLGINGG